MSRSSAEDLAEMQELMAGMVRVWVDASAEQARQDRAAASAEFYARMARAREEQCSGCLFRSEGTWRRAYQKRGKCQTVEFCHFQSPQMVLSDMQPRWCQHWAPIPPDQGDA